METKRNYYLLNKPNNVFIIFLLLIQFTSIRAVDIQTDTVNNMEISAKSENIDLKAVTAGSWNALSNGSDYYITISWSGLKGTPCSCDYTRTVKATKNGSQAFSITSNGTSGSKAIAMGPSQSADFRFYSSWSGGNIFITCLTPTSCSGTENGTSTLTRSTNSIKAPASVTASDDLYDDGVLVQWTGGTNIPKSSHGYKIYRDYVLVYTSPYNLSKYEWKDVNATPGVNHYYQVATYTNGWSGHTSWGYGDYGMCFNLDVKATQDKKNYAEITWNDPEIIGANKLRIERNDGTSTELLETFDKPFPDLYRDYNGIPGYKYTYIVTPFKDSNPYKSSSAIGAKLANGTIKGEITAPFGGGIENVDVCAKLISDIPQGDTSILYCATTDGSGYYEINNIYYFEEATFKVFPTKEEHYFDPEFKERKIDGNSTVITGVNFVDTSSFTLSGRIVQIFNGDTCPVSNVEMLLDDLYKGAKTDAMGYFKVTVENAGTHTVKPRMEGRGFVPSYQTLTVDRDSTLTDFVDTTMHYIDGSMLASCDIYIGTADLRIYSSGPLGCFDTTVTTEENTGYYNVKLPARKYNIELSKFESKDLVVVSNDEVETYFTTLEADISNSDSTKNVIYRKAPEVQVSGFEEYGCGDYNNIPIMEQLVRYRLRIDVIEKFGSDSCHANTGFVVITNNLGDNPKTDTVNLDEGVAYYDVIPGEPNIISPNLKSIEIVAHIDDETDLYSQQVLVTGYKPREKTFVSVSPEIPFMILRDPPGDASYSFLEKGTTFQTAMRFSGKASASVNAWAELKAGVKFEAGLGVSTETSIWGTIKGSLEVGSSIGGQDEFIMSITNGEEFTTSGNQDVTGEKGDVYIGSSINLLYALTDVIDYKKSECKVNKTTDIVVGADGFQTTFIYTEDHIKNTLIPQLEEIRNVYAAVGSDSAKLYENQISVWKQTLKHNEDLKKKSKFIENRSFSAGGQYKNFQEISKTENTSLEFDMYIEAGVAIEAGLEVGGVGLSGGVQTKFRIDVGVSETNTNMVSTKTGYVLNDDDIGDFFSVDILSDNVYGTPVFKLISGRSSCPWEPGTQPREGVQLISDTYNQFVGTPEGEAVFKLSLGNLSQSNESRLYNLVFLQQSNPDAAKISLGGSPVQGGIPTPYVIDAFQSVDATVTVKRGPIAYDYNGLQFMLTSGCSDNSIKDIISLNVAFQSICSDIAIAKPINGWYVNKAADNKLVVKIDNYDLNALDRVKFQYGAAGSNSWKTLMIFEKEDLNDITTEFVWNTEEIPEGLFDIRTVVECSEGLKYSNKVTGILDREPPKKLGLPQPADGVFSGGDVISVTFNEPVNCYKLSNANVVMKNITSGKAVTTTLGCADDKIIIIPEDVEIAGIDTFEVMVMNVEDIYNNKMNDTIIWTFTSGDASAFTLKDDDDTDGDGILNKDDNCPYTANEYQEDQDGDKMGDACDNDIDGDGIENASDNCPFTINTDQKDSNANGVGDVCEDDADGDGDGIKNSEDNCPNISNADQTDTDMDGEGDACDNDIDGDGVINISDNCPFTANPDQADINTNGKGDICDDATEISEIVLNNNDYVLFNNYPNPFSNKTIIKYYVPETSDVILAIYNSLGEVVDFYEFKNEITGTHEVEWVSANTSNGLYFYSLKAVSNVSNQEYFEMKKMTIIH